MHNKRKINFWGFVKIVNFQINLLIKDFKNIKIIILMKLSIFVIIIKINLSVNGGILIRDFYWFFAVNFNHQEWERLNNKLIIDRASRNLFIQRNRLRSFLKRKFNLINLKPKISRIFFVKKANSAQNYFSGLKILDFNFLA